MAGEKDLSENKLPENAASCPDINRWSVVSGPEKDLWSLVVPSCYVVGMHTFWRAVGLGESEIDKFDLPLVIEHHVCRGQVLQVRKRYVYSMHDELGIVQVVKGTQNLLYDILDMLLS